MDYFLYFDQNVIHDDIDQGLFKYEATKNPFAGDTFAPFVYGRQFNDIVKINVN